MPCSTTSTARLRSAISIVASSAMRSGALRGARARPPPRCGGRACASGGCVAEVDLGAGGDARGAREILHRADDTRTGTGAGCLRDGRDELDAVAERDRRRTRARLRAGRRRAASRSPAALERGEQRRERLGVAHGQRGVGLRRRARRVARRRTCSCCGTALRTSSRRGPPAPRASRARRGRAGRRRTRGPAPRSPAAPPPARGRCRVTPPSGSPAGNANGPRACGGRARYRVRDSNPCYRRERPAS